MTNAATNTLDAWGFDHSQDGFHRNMKNGKIVWLDGIRHFRDATSRIHANFRGTRNGKPFGRTCSATIEDFYERYSPESAVQS